MDPGISFPLKRLHEVIIKEVWGDRLSEDLWKKTFPRYPYQLWASDPTTTDAALTLHDVEIVCPRCQNNTIINLTEFTEMHITKKSKCKCSSCNAEFTADTVSANNLRQDLKFFISTEEVWYDFYLIV
jgi:hypothetical protein